MLQLRAPYTPALISKSAFVDAKRGDFRASVVRTMDDILASCPTDAEIEAIRKDFLFTFDSKPETLKCTAGGTESGALLSLYNAFRCMKALTFDKPIPLIGNANLYAWMKGLGYSIHVFDGDAYSHSSGKEIYLRRNILGTSKGFPDDGWWVRSWDNGRGLGMISLIGLLVHESAHLAFKKGHPCTFESPGSTLPAGVRIRDDGLAVFPDGAIRRLTETERDNAIWGGDPSLEYGGAWAAQYWFDRWLADHSGSYLSDAEKQSAGRLAETMRADGFFNCGIPIPKPGFLMADRNAILREAPKDPPSHTLVSKAGPSTSVAPQVQKLPEVPFFMRVTGVGASLTSEWTDDDLRELADIAARSRILDPAYLLKVMASESGLHPWAAYRTDSAGKPTKDKSGYPYAAGIIQLTPSANEHVGITEEERADIVNWSVSEQLPLVDRYYSRLPWTKAGRDYDSAAAVYFANFAGSRMMSRGTDPGTVIYSSADGEAYSRNNGFDRAKKGYITVQDLADHLDVVEKDPAYQEALARLREVAGYPEASSTPWWKYALGGLFVAGVGVYAVVK